MLWATRSQMTSRSDHILRPRTLGAWQTARRVVPGRPGHGVDPRESRVLRFGQHTHRHGWGEPQGHDRGNERHVPCVCVCAGRGLLLEPGDLGSGLLVGARPRRRSPEGPSSWRPAPGQEPRLGPFAADPDVASVLARRPVAATRTTGPLSPGSASVVEASLAFLSIAFGSWERVKNAQMRKNHLPKPVLLASSDSSGLPRSSASSPIFS